MTAYVDTAMIRADVPHRGRTVRGTWCHLMADTREELDAMADRIGLRRAWIQNPGTWKEHYDLTLPRRSAAIRAGAVEVTMREAVEMLRQKRTAAATTLDRRGNVSA